MTNWQIKHNAIGILIAIVLTGFSYGLGLKTGWITEISRLEAFAVFTGYWCVYLCAVQTRWNYPVNMVSVAALGFLFYQQNLLASAALQVYLFLTLPYGWYFWRKDADTRPVRNIALDWSLMGYVFLIILSYVVAVQVNEYFHGSNTAWDTSIFVASILAQWTLDRKRLQSWGIWIAVDIVSTWLYWSLDLKIVAIQSALFGLNAVLALVLWYKSMSNESETFAGGFEQPV